jgi:hypothetical protein
LAGTDYGWNGWKSDPNARENQVLNVQFSLKSNGRKYVPPSTLSLLCIQ